MAVTITERTHTSVKKITWAWTSAADGTAGGSGGGGRTSVAFDGVLERLVTVPDGTAAPTDNYDITITDEDSVDVLVGAGANRSATATQQVTTASLSAAAGSRLTLNVTNAGNAKSGTVHLYLR